jgi:hypothetical protein
MQEFSDEVVEAVRPTTTDSPKAKANGADLFDISSLATLETSEMVVNHPVSGAPTTWVWVIAGPGHPATVRADSERAEETKQEELRMRRAQANGQRYKPPTITAQEERRRSASNFARRVLSWTKVQLNGQEYEHNYENVYKILMDPNYFLVYRQLLDYLVDEKSFMKPSSLS